MAVTASSGGGPSRLSLGLAAAGLLGLVAAGGLALGAPAEGRWAGLLAGLGLGFLAASVAREWRNWSTHRRRTLLYGGNAALYTGIVLAILGGLYFLATRHPVRFDWTAHHQFSLSDQTVQVLTGLDQAVRVRAYFQAGSPEETAVRDFLAGYRQRTPHLEVTSLDPIQDPAAAQADGVTRYGTLVLERTLAGPEPPPTPEAGGAGAVPTLARKTERVEEVITVNQLSGTPELARDLEEKLTNALMTLLGEATPTVCFLTGYGERDLAGEDERGLRVFREELGKDQYAIQSVPVLPEPAVPEACHVLVAAGPTVTLHPATINAIDRYLTGGGRALFLLEPNTTTGLEAYLARWRVTVGEDVVLYRDRLFADLGQTDPIATEYPPHPITETFRALSFFPLARSVTPAPAGDAAGITVQSLALTAAEVSWAEADTTLTPPRQYDAGTDAPGPVSLGVAVKGAPLDPAPDAPAPEADTTPPAEDRPAPRLVVFGDADFVSNRCFWLLGNGHLALNAVGWLTEREDLITIRPRSRTPTPLLLRRDQQRLLFWGCVGGLPGGVLAIGGLLWWRRRQR